MLSQWFDAMAGKKMYQSKSAKIGKRDGQKKDYILTVIFIMCLSVLFLGNILEYCLGLIPRKEEYGTLDTGRWTRIQFSFPLWDSCTKTMKQASWDAGKVARMKLHCAAAAARLACQGHVLAYAPPAGCACKIQLWMTASAAHCCSHTHWTCRQL